MNYGTYVWVPCSQIGVKPKVSYSSGLIDLHFHGAFGIDLMHADLKSLDHLSQLLWRNGIAGFCPTTISAPFKLLKERIRILGTWISQQQPDDHTQRSIPLGIHLEGPYINRLACGAHPPSTIRSLSMEELDKLWELSQGTLKLLTIAPETLQRPVLKKLGPWARSRNITISLGHSLASEQESTEAIKRGFSGITHAWNALRFHQRNPGPLGAALAHKGIHVEIIPDLVHVDLTVIRWTRELHESGVCFVSDCAPAACTTKGSWHSFGPLRTRLAADACRLPGGSLAGGGLLLSQAYIRWLQAESKVQKVPLGSLFHASIEHVTENPIRALRLKSRVIRALKARQMAWSLGKTPSFRWTD